MGALEGRGVRMCLDASCLCKPCGPTDLFCVCPVYNAHSLIDICNICKIPKPLTHLKLNYIQLVQSGHVLSRLAGLCITQRCLSQDTPHRANHPTC